MKQFKSVFIILLLLFCFQQESVFAQIGMDAAKIAAHGVLALVGGNREAKKERIIEQSAKQEKISGSNATVLRVKEPDIKSKAKKNIIALQNRLDQYYNQYKNNQPIDIPKSDSDLTAIQDKDENWPVEDYISELKAYKRYAFQQKQKMSPVPGNNLNTTPANTEKKDTAASKL